MTLHHVLLTFVMSARLNVGLALASYWLIDRLIDWQWINGAAPQIINEKTQLSKEIHNGLTQQNYD